MTTPRALAAHPHRSATVLTGAITLTAAAAWAVHHAVTASRYGEQNTSRLAAVWTATFVLLLAQTLMYHWERPRKVTAHGQRHLAALHVAVLLPVYNEDPGYLRLGLGSLLHQTRPPTSVHVVDDGSTTTDYADVRAWWTAAAARAGITTTWQRTPNRGKRHAQAAGVDASPQADIYVTVDSDSCLDHRALDEILKPFAPTRRRTRLRRPRPVQSVAGIVLATNHRTNWLTRITDLWFLTGQLTDRSALSAMGAVLVNSGPLAAYRAPVVRDNLASYLGETFMGRPVMFSDDSLLTLYALLRGRTVQQPSAVVFTALPEKPSHFARMYMRWMRGSTIRSLWRMRYLPVTGYAYWAQIIRWFQVALSTAVLAWLLVIEPVQGGTAPSLAFLAVPVLIGWAQALRYLGIIRTDERIRQRAATWLLMPLAVLGSWTILRAMRWYGIATCARTGWGTRQTGAEVTLNTPETTAPVPAPRKAYDHDTIPLTKLRDPYDDTTLQVATPVRTTHHHATATP